MLVLLLFSRSFWIGLKVIPLYLYLLFEIVFYLCEYLSEYQRQLLMYVLGCLIMFLYLETMPGGSLSQRVLDGMQSLLAVLSDRWRFCSCQSRTRHGHGQGLVRPHGALVIDHLTSALSMQHKTAVCLLELLLLLLFVFYVQILIQNVVETLVVFLHVTEGFQLHPS